MANNEYYAQSALFTNDDVKKAFAVCIIKNLAYVKNEADTTANHTNRIAYANKILTTGSEWTNALAAVPVFFGHLLSSGGTISGDGTKADWDYAFAAIYDVVANAEVL
jgi:hypothetical protein